MWPPLAQVMKARATAATPRSTSAYSAVVWPRWPVARWVTSSVVKSIDHPPLRRHGGRSCSNESQAQAAQGAGEERRHREQREGRQDADHERERELHRRSAGLLVGATAGVGPGFGRQPLEALAYGGAVPLARQQHGDQR